MLPNDLNKWFVEGIKNAMTSLDRVGALLMETSDGGSSHGAARMSCKLRGLVGWTKSLATDERPAFAAIFAHAERPTAWASC
jgi:hypothetical protein